MTVIEFAYLAAGFAGGLAWAVFGYWLLSPPAAYPHKRIKVDNGDAGDTVDIPVIIQAQAKQAAEGHAYIFNRPPLSMNDEANHANGMYTRFCNCPACTEARSLTAAKTG